MKKSVVLVSLLAVSLMPVAADAQAGAVAITIPLPVSATLTFGQAPAGFTVAAGLKVHVAGNTATITSASSAKPLPKVVGFKASNTLCFAKGVQRSLTLITAIQPKQLVGVPACPMRR
jgi:hypothetical protein